MDGRGRLSAARGPGRRQGIAAEGIYPGGQSENPASPWYGNLVARWASGRYLPMPPAGVAASGPIRWELRP
jgi:penicillin G amidase